MPVNQIYPYYVFTLCFLSVVLGSMNSVLSSAYLPDILTTLARAQGEAEAGLIGAWINFAFPAGAVLGGIAFGFLSDRVGRRAILALSLIFYGAGSAAGAMAPGWEFLIFTRVLVGMGVGSTLVLSAVIISETWPARMKPVSLGILSVAYPVGIIASGLVTANLANWRSAFFIGASALLLALPVRYTIRENFIRPENNEFAPVLTGLKAYRKTLLSGILVYGTMLIGIWAAFAWLPTWIQSLLTTSVAEGQDARGNSVMLLGGGGLIGGILSGFLANLFGSKTVQAACFIGSLALSYWLFQRHTVYSGQILPGIALLGFCFGLSQGVLNNYIPELFPAALRSSATGLCFHAGRVFTAAAVFFIGAFVVWFGGYGNAIFAFSLVYIAGLAALLLVKDSKTITPD